MAAAYSGLSLPARYGPELYAPLCVLDDLIDLAVEERRVREHELTPEGVERAVYRTTGDAAEARRAGDAARVADQVVAERYSRR